MTLTWDKIAEVVLSTLSNEERQTSAVYLDERVRAAGTDLEIDRKTLRARFDAAVAFVDLHPQLNWGHDCRYVLINVETGEVESIPAHFPPFLRGAPQTLRLIWRGERVPEWTPAC